MTTDTSGATTQRGFSFQDLSALYLFLQSIKTLNSFKVEGNEDIDLNWKENKISLIQAKETVDPLQSFNTVYIKDALSLLSKDLSTYKNKPIKSIIFLTNSHFPFGKKIESKNGNQFNNENYCKYSYKNLSSEIKEKIQSWLKSDKKLKNITIDLSKLYIIKIPYQGDDTKTREIELEKEIEKFMGQAHITLDKYIPLKSQWNEMICQNKIIKDPDKVITKEQFMGNTSLIYLYDQTPINEFIQEFQPSISIENYIKSNYMQHLQSLTMDMSIVNIINSLICDYKQENPNPTKNSKREIQKDFINKKCNKFASLIKLKINNENLFLSKLIMWILISNEINFNFIKDAIN
ncbi:dsDNA nuclease domain-containing protein [Lactobacillus sp. ESL0791]|uniref:dsDNA nuclease domain-containing protein n=1 Tax=Lactobacillus sp. ESL0791 TaxID=2983234 RepID=UPI0023FA416E|nr:dsDNA nuclease domain-containing protein [Lactobacillus sp. ESL0791]MDF7638109.1 dsDNA nuclease domain-containing protein [Lactobacillus sp. ESL0791]